MNIDWISRAQALKLQVRNFVEGAWCEIGGELQKKFAPRDGRLLCEFGTGRAREVDEAVASARAAFEDGRWARLPLPRRKAILYTLAELIEKHGEEFALLECLDVGKPISDAVNYDVPTSIEIIRASAEAADKVYGKVFAVDSSTLSYQLRRPVGVVAAIVGWNFPLVLAAGKIGPVLATGNSLVLKPSEVTSLSTARLAELAIQAGVPEGVFNVVNGDGEVGAAMARHFDVDLVTFTGSSRIGKELLVASGRSNLKRVILECGGKSPNIVFDDSPDLEAVADAIIARAFWNQGQVCTAGSRLLVQETVKQPLIHMVLQRMTTYVPGDPLKWETAFGPVVSKSHRSKIVDFIDSGRLQGATQIYESSFNPPFADGAYIGAAIFDNVDPRQKIAQEEIFGPVLSVMSFRDEGEAIQLANSTTYGLSATLWTKDLGRAHRVSHGVRAGWVAINATDKPSGGPAEGVISIGGLKQSGIGVEGGIEGLESYTTSTAVQYFT